LPHHVNGGVGCWQPAPAWRHVQACLRSDAGKVGAREASSIGVRRWPVHRVSRAVVAALVWVCFCRQQRAGQLHLCQLLPSAMLTHAVGTVDFCRLRWMRKLSGDAFRQTLVSHAHGLHSPQKPALAGYVCRFYHARSDRRCRPLDGLLLHAILLRVQELIAAIALPRVALNQHNLHIRCQRAAEQGSIARGAGRLWRCAELAELPQCYRNPAQRRQHAYECPAHECTAAADRRVLFSRGGRWRLLEKLLHLRRHTSALVRSTHPAKPRAVAALVAPRTAGYPTREYSAAAPAAARVYAAAATLRGREPIEAWACVLCLGLLSEEARALSPEGVACSPC
jgi:hypothetical protein